MLSSRPEAARSVPRVGRDGRVRLCLRPAQQPPGRLGDLFARIEQQFSKEEILEAYMNRIYFGSTVYGIETASQTYFGKRAADLSLGEAAMIAGIIRAPPDAATEYPWQRVAFTRPEVFPDQERN